MLKVGLSGGIGSGKSAAAAVFAELGALVVDSDKVAREVVEPGTPGLAALAEAFGSEILADDGTLERPTLAAKVFGDDEARAQLNAITHPLVAARSQELMDAAAPGQIVVRDVPLLVELHLAPFFHLAVVVDAPLAERLRRLTEMRGMAREDALARIKSQASDEQRRSVADVWLDNSTSEAELRERVRELWFRRLVPFNEGLLRGERVVRHPYELVPYDATWPAQAERLMGRIKVAAGGKALRVDHIGSTAVPGLAGKDVIDLQLTVASLDVADELAVPLLGAGFVKVERITHDDPNGAAANSDAVPEVWAKRFHASADPGRPANLHLRVDGWPNQRFALVFRDWLRANPEIAQEYEGVKHKAVIRGEQLEAEAAGKNLPTPPGGWAAEGYHEVKEPWFASTYTRAQTWAKQTGWRA